MNKIYAFLIIIPILAMLLFKSITFYEYDTKQRYIKNVVDGVAHKVMITGVMTANDKIALLSDLKKLGKFEEQDITLLRGDIAGDGIIGSMATYSVGTMLYRGDIFSIYVQSKDESTFSRVEQNSINSGKQLYYKAKAVCRIEKNHDE